MNWCQITYSKNEGIKIADDIEGANSKKSKIDFFYDNEEQSFRIKTNIRPIIVHDRFIILNTGQKNINFGEMSILECAKRIQGLIFEFSGNEVYIYNDPFSTIPMYIYLKSELLIGASEFEHFKGYELSVDRVGMYETLMYASGLWNRTLFSEIQQMPAATKYVINLDNMTDRIESYWDYAFKCDTSIDSEDKAAKLTWDTLQTIYGEYDDADYVMGLSGGLDSRLSLLLLSRRLKDYKGKIDTYTFGHSRCIKDYTYAKQVCKNLGMPVPAFYKISGDVYKKYSFIPEKSGGFVGNGHCHSYWCLDKMSNSDSNNFDNKTMISNYYSDAIMGYDCRPDDVSNPFESDYYRLIVANHWNAPKEILDIIVSDYNNVVQRRNEEDNFSGYNEYIYLTERNPKFHILLNYLYSEFITVKAPFARYELLEIVLACPQQYRYYKKLEKIMLNNNYGYQIDISSNRYAGREKAEENFFSRLFYDTNYMIMKLLNRMNAGLCLLTKGRIQIPNSYITENHLQIVERYFSKDKDKAYRSLRRFLDKNVLDRYLVHRLYRTTDAERAWQLVDLNLVIEKYLHIEEM